MKKNSYNATLLLASALVLLSSINAIKVTAQDKKSTTTPKLIIGIAVDQLRTDYLYALEHKLGENGLKRLLNEGVVYENVTFDFDNPDAAAALAVLATGTDPFYNGVPSASIFNQQMLRKQSVFYDKQYIGNTTTANLSPLALISSNLADELDAATSGAAKIFAIAPDAESALISAGHTADCAVWIDDRSGKWSSTTYYKEFPQYIVRQNSDKPLFIEFSSKTTWKPLPNNTGRLDIMPYQQNSKSAFAHTFHYTGQPVYQWVKTSPLINDAIIQLSKTCIQQSHLGQGTGTDMLQLTFYAGTFMHESPESYASELQDIYLRLDKNIADLLSTVESYIGLSNTFIYLTGTGATDDNVTDIPGTLVGEFNAARCSALLNSYLISLYGQGNWVDGLENFQVYLNHKTIEDKKLRLSEVQKSAAEFVTMFSGVSDVVYAYQMLHEDYSERIDRMRKGYNKAYGGDLIIQLQTGWAFKANDTTPAKSQIRSDIAPGPAIIFAPGRISAKRITKPVDATAIAPTVAKSIRIRAPSGCKQLPLETK